VRSLAEVRTAQLLVHLGLNDCQVSRTLGIPRCTIRDWRHGRTPGREGRLRRHPLGACDACGAAAHDFGALPAAPYAYLLALYLGDGHLARHRRGVYRLQIFLDERYPQIIDECAAAIEAVIGKPAGRYPKVGCIQVSSWSKQWPCLFPQHGPGPKHRRPIVLADWQQAIVDEHPELFLRRLVHSDGCRSMNTVKVRGRTYSYPRYTFCNASDDIRQMFCDACDTVGVEWRRMNARNISVARRASVARLDEFIGPKR
jgi:hypothetical protein